MQEYLYFHSGSYQSLKSVVLQEEATGTTSLDRRLAEWVESVPTL